MMKIIATLNEQFKKIHKNSCVLIKKTPLEKLYWQPRKKKSSEISMTSSCGELILRSAGVVEQTFSGLTCNLWDDPFEWTLPEALSKNEKVIEYLQEVEETRQRGFALLKSDEDLYKEISNSANQLQPLNSLLIETLVKASHYQGRAFTIFCMFSE